MKVNWKLILMHLLFWVLYLIVWGIKDMAYAPTFMDTVDGNLIGSIWYSIGVYLNLYLLIPHLLLKKQGVVYGVTLVGLILVVSYLCAQSFAYYYLSEHVPTAQFFGSVQGIANTGSDFLVVLGLSTCLYFINEWYIKERKLRELESRNLRAELDLLKGQINPHFLFNALNSVHVLIRTNPQMALKTLEKFSDLLSHQIYEVSKERVLLESEIDNLNNYVELQQLRYGNHIEVSWKVSGSRVGKRIAPMLFLNFVENAFKYSEADREDKGAKVDILLAVKNEMVTFSCVNSLKKNKPETERPEPGLGLFNVRRRLEILYPGKHQLKIEQTVLEYSVYLELDLSEN